MKLEPLDLDGAHLLVPEPNADHRGFFARSFSAAQLAEAGLETEFPEWSLSYNARAGTLRGLHWQAPPHLEVKMVRCVRGAVHDVIVDLRPGPSSYGRWTAVTLSAGNRHTLYVPAGFAHGFQALEDHSELMYYISEPFRPDAARGVRWNDPELGIDWPDPDAAILSERDAALPLLSELA